MGINAAAVHYGLMAAVSGTCVAAFESVGSILVVAMLIVPGATAHLLTDRLSRMLLIAAAVAVSSSIIGYWLAAYVIDTPAAGMMALVAGAHFVLAVFFAPRHGFLSKKLHQATLALRILRQDVLGMLYRWQEAGRAEPLTRHHVAAALGGGWLPRLALWTMNRSGLVTVSGSTVLLAPSGVTEARGLVRAHRLWEAYLNKHFGLPLDHLHAPAERMEHFVGADMQTRLEREVGAPADPHGREIPK
jgi:manganese/zinc/iron transport system permease protein